MEIRCPSCAHPIDLPDDASNGDESRSLYSFTSVDCPNCGSVSLGPAYRKTISYHPKPDETGLTQVAHFRLVRKLGRGGFGTVWLAHDLSLNREVALKLPASRGREADNLLHEAQTAASLRHPNIVSIYEVGNDDGRAYIACEYIDGLTLRDLLSAGRPDIGRTVELITTVALALQHAHEHGVVHRDVKPANILLNRQGQPFVADFGIAKRISADSTITSEGRVVGTARYMSPEQASGKTRETDRRSDIYALGVILFEMLTGDTPFRGNVRALLHQKLMEEVPSPRKLDPTLPRDLETIGLKCLEREPAKRYQTALELAEELQRFSNGEPIQARPITPLERLWRRAKRYPVVAALIAGLFLSLTSGLLGVSAFWLDARASALRTQQSLYRSQMNVAARALDQGDIAGVRISLERYGPGRPLEHLRGFEWHYFQDAIAPIVEVANQGDVVYDVAVSRDSSLCAACGNDRVAHVWDARTGAVTHALKLPAGQIRSLEFSPTQVKRLATGASDGKIRVWDLAKADAPAVEIKHGPPVALVRYSPDGSKLLSAGNQGAVRVWDVQDQSLVVEIPSGQGGMVDARFSPDGQQVAVASPDGTLRIWNLQRELLHMLPSNTAVQALAYSDDGRTIVTGTYTGRVHIWSVEDESLLHTVTLIWRIGDLEFLQNSRVLAIASSSGEVYFYDVDTKRELFKLKTHYLTRGLLARSADGKNLAIGSGDGGVKLVRLREAVRPDVFWHDAAVRAVAFLPDGKHVAAADSDGSLKLWNIETGQSQEICAATHQPLTALAVQPGGRLMAAGGAGPEVRIWDCQTKALQGTVSVGQTGVMAVDFSPSGKRLAIAVRNGPILVYDEGSWEKSAVAIDRKESPVTALTYSFDGTTLIAGHENGEIRFFDAVTGAERESLLQLKTVPSAFCHCGPARLWLAIGTDSGEIHVWDPYHHDVRHSFKGHSGRVASLAALPDGVRLLSGGRDRDLKLWDVETGEPITILDGHVRQIFGVAVSPDGSTLVSGGLDGDVRLWRGEAGTNEKISAEK